MTTRPGAMTREDLVDLFEDRFLYLVQEQLPDKHPNGLSDRKAIHMLVDMLLNGKTHAEATRGECSTASLLFRHREYARSPVLGQFLREYGELYRYYTEGGERPSFLPKHDYPFGTKAGR